MDEKSIASPATQFSAFNLLTAWEQPICGGVATPFVDSQTIYVACEHNYIFALNPTGDNHVRWRYDLSDLRLTAMESLNDGVLVGSDHKLYALDGSTGQVRWQYELRALGLKRGAFLTPSVSHIKYVSPYIHFLNHSGLFTLDSGTGEERHFTSSGREWHHLTADTNLIYVIDKYNGIVEALAPEASWPSWYFECGASIKFAPALDNSFLYCGSHDGYLHVIEKRTGQLKASIQVDAPLDATPVPGGNDLVFVVTEKGSVLALDIRRTLKPNRSSQTFNTAGKELLWRFELEEGKSLQDLLLFEAALFVATKDGIILGLDAQTGQLIWQHDLNTSRPLLCRSGDTLIAGISGKVVAFRTPPGFGSRPGITRTDAQPGPQRSVRTGDAGEDLISPVVFAPPVDLKLPELNLPQQVWSISLPEPITTDIVVGSSHVIVGCEEHILVSVNPENGSLLWRLELESDLQEAWPVAPDSVCVADEGNVYCIDVDGNRRWQRRIDGPAQCGVDTGDGVAFYTRNGTQLVCVDKTAGETLWECDGQENSRRSQPCSDGVLLFAAGRHGVRALLVESGAESWSTTTIREVTSPLFYSNGRVFAGCADTRLYAFDAHSGELLWVFKTKDQICYRPTEVANHFLVIAGQDQFVYSLNAVDGTLRWRHALGNVPCGDPCVAEDSVYIGTSKGFDIRLNCSFRSS